MKSIQILNPPYHYPLSEDKDNTVLEIDLSKSHLEPNMLHQILLEILVQARLFYPSIQAKMRFSQAVAFSSHNPPIILCGNTFNDFKFDKIIYVKGD